MDCRMLGCNWEAQMETQSCKQRLCAKWDNRFIENIKNFIPVGLPPMCVVLVEHSRIFLDIGNNLLGLK